MPGGHPIKIVVADDTSFVEHLGNAGRPHAVANRYISGRPLGHQAPHRPYVVTGASLCTQHNPSGKRRAFKPLDTDRHTGNDRYDWLDH
jgi:hypothetical protein